MNNFQRVYLVLFSKENWGSLLGMLTFCPTNLGTTIRASVHVKLPKLAAGGQGTNHSAPCGHVTRCSSPIGRRRSRPWRTSSSCRCAARPGSTARPWAASTTSATGSAWGSRSSRSHHNYWLSFYNILNAKNIISISSGCQENVRRRQAADQDGVWVVNCETISNQEARCKIILKTDQIKLLSDSNLSN